ncbi:MAG: hypothetical protein K2G37_00130, partial [Clostridia bacterium]|nr:hypothetical protein [Clostridia bacterium]
KDTDHYQWDGAPTTSNANKLTMKIAPKTIKATLTAENGDDTAVGKEGMTVKVVLDIDANVNKIFDNHPLKFKICAEKDGSIPEELTNEITLTEDGTTQYTLSLTELSWDTVLYDLYAECSGDEYELEFTNKPKLKVEEDNKNVIRWQLYVGGKIVTGFYLDSDISSEKNSDGEIEVTFNADEELSKMIYYTGGYYTFAAKQTPIGYTVKTNSYNNGYKTDYDNTSNTNPGVNADSYTTRVDVWVSGDLDTVVTFVINWKISPALFDLSGVKWTYDDGELPYNDGNNVYQVIDPTTLPKGLVIKDCTTNYGSIVTEYGTAEVFFDFDPKYPAYASNYILPVEGDKSTYTGFDPDDANDDFEWKKDWKIVPYVIKTTTNYWGNVAHPDSDKTFSVLELTDPVAKLAVDYLFYETDTSGKILDPSAGLNINDLAIPSDGTKWYVAKPVLLDSNNYALDDADATSRPFKISSANANAKKITVAPAKTSFTYNTQARHITVTTTGVNLNNAYFNLYYYKEDGTTMMGGAPVECGNYWVEISIKDEYADKYIIQGTTRYQFEVVPAEITPDWKTTARPPVLNLAYGQINAIQYTIIDEDGNEIAKVASLEADKTYQIKATIKEPYRKNIQFSVADAYGSNYDTDYVTFSLTAADIEGGLYDPNDPNNPNYPTTDPDAPSTTPNNPNDTNDPNNPTNPPDGDGNKGINWTKVKGFLQSYWQPIVAGISLFLTLIFFSKGLSYASKRKKIKKQIKKNYTPAYALALFTSTDKLWGIEYKIWEIIAFTLVGVAVLSLLFMILEKHSYKKSKEDLEEAQAEFARNPAAFAPAMAGAGAGMVAASVAPQEYAESGKSSKKKD